MQVAHHNDHITHAVIGGKQSIEFGISNSAEFFNILSSTLYKDQILAVVREVLCNAWDAHIEAGCTDRPVLITLTEDKFTIQDFGKGIHADDMGLIYGTYGNSTKKNDGTQTGGFGLGCKAPFAYTDHFEVVSCHAGIKTIYNLSKSSAQAMGKPGITPIVSFPTTDSGLTVSIGIKPNDRHRFHELITRITHNGDMNMQLNGKQIGTLDFDTSKNNFLLVSTSLLDSPSRIMVRYGNVIYPADSSKNEALYSAIVKHLDSLNTYRARYSIVFQAPPHSIAVTPSRESLSMQDHTINTLKTLFTGFLKSLDTEFKEVCSQYTEEVIQQAVAAQRIDELLKRDEAIPFLERKDPPPVIGDFKTMAHPYMELNYPKDLAYRKKDLTYRLETMVKANLLDRGLVSSFLRELKHVEKNCSRRGEWNTTKEDTSWLQKRVLAPLLKKLASAGLPINNLYSCNPEDRNWRSSNREGIPPLVPATKTSPYHLLTTIPYLRNIVVISTRRQNLTNSAYRHEVFKAAGNYYGFLVYLAGRKKGEVDAAREFFAKAGMRVVDLTLVNEEEKEYTHYIASPTPRKPAKKGVAKLSSVSYGTGINVGRLLFDDIERTESPEFILQVSLRDSTSLIDFWTQKGSSIVVRLFGDKGGITNSTATYDKWCAKGAIPFRDYVREKVCSYMLNNPRIALYWGYHVKHIEDKRQVNTRFIQCLFSNEAFAKEFGLAAPLTDEDKDYLVLWAELEQHYSRYTSNVQVTQVRDWLATLPLAPAVDSLIKKINGSLFSLVNTNEFRWAIDRASPQELPRLITFFKTILNS